MHKRAQSLSLHTIIIAIIALIVLLVIILIFTGQIRIFGSGLQSCIEKGGQCKQGEDCVQRGDETVCSCPEGMVQIPNADCGTNMVCCMEIFQETTP